jgi:predicted PurR-regulated permease PerM
MKATHFRLLLWAMAITAILIIVYQARIALIPFIIGTLFAYMVSPLVDRISKIIPVKTHRGDVWRRGISVLVVYAIALGALIALFTAIAPSVAEQTRSLVDNLPELLENARVQSNVWTDQVRELLPESVRARFDQYLGDLIKSFSSGATRTIENDLGLASSAITTTISIILGFLVVPFWMFYAIRDRHFAENNLMNTAPEEVRDDIKNIAKIGDSVLGRYIRSQLILGLIVGTVVGVALQLLGVQWALWLGVWAGFTELIPLAGPWIGAIAGLILIAATEPGLFVWVALVYFGVQVIENMFLVPRIQGRAVQIHPGMVLLLLVIAGSIWGALGVILIVPIAALARELFWYADHRLKGKSPNEAYEETHVAQL